MYTLINSLEDLKTLNQELILKSHIGVDTEFRRTTKTNMRLSLLQDNDGEEIYLIDCIAIGDPKDECAFLYSDSVTKILHSCKEDLEATYSWTKRKMENIFDTQLAYSFLGKDYSISYQGLVEERLEITLEKKETRSNWLRRPLTDSQLKYAALDVEYLLPLYEELRNELLQNDKLKWLDEDIQQLIKFTFNPFLSLNDQKRSIPKVQENELLIQLNKAVEYIAKENHINETLFFSKKTQKNFLRFALINGIDDACKNITKWRSYLIREKILDLLR